MRRNEIRAAVIGSGFIGAVHIEALSRIGVRITGLLESSAELGERRAADLGLVRSYANLEDLLADDTVQVVHVTSPNYLHYSQVKAVLAAGRHVVCEKPLALTSHESVELLELAASSGLVHAVNFSVRYYPLNQHVSALIREGSLGDVRLLTGHYFQDWLLYETDWNWRLDADQGGALRAVSDIGSHWIDLLTFLTGRRLEAVMADLTTFMPVRWKPSRTASTFSTDRSAATTQVEIHTEDVATILLRLEGGARGSVAISQVSPGRKNSLTYQIDGSSSAVAWDSEQPEQLWIGHRDRPNELLLRNPALMNSAGAAAARLPGGHVEGFADTFSSTFIAIYDDVMFGRPSPDPRYATFRDGHEEILIGEAVLESSRSGRWVAIAREAVVAAVG